MNDPHVSRLHYEIWAGEGTTWDSPPAVAFKNYLGRFETEGLTLRIDPVEHFARQEDAEAAMTAFLAAWSIDSDLRLGVDLRFRFLRADVHDRMPDGRGFRGSALRAFGGTVTMAGEVKLVVTRRRLTKPRAAFQATDEVTTAYRRWNKVQAEAESLQGMAYWLLTVFETRGGSRRKAAERFRVDLQVLGRIGDLSTNTGSPDTERKQSPQSLGRELRAGERQWLEAAVKRLILRLGSSATGASEATISLADLPPLADPRA